MNEAIRMVFNINPKVKTIFKDGINRMLKEVFPDNYYGNNEYAEGEVAGVYDLETQGRSVLNKLNTNYSCFCVLLNNPFQRLFLVVTRYPVACLVHPGSICTSSTHLFVQSL